MSDCISENLGVQAGPSPRGHSGTGGGGLETLSLEAHMLDPSALPKMKRPQTGQGLPPVVTVVMAPPRPCGCPLSAAFPRRLGGPRDPKVWRRPPAPPAPPAAGPLLPSASQPDPQRLLAGEGRGPKGTTGANWDDVSSCQHHGAGCHGDGLLCGPSAKQGVQSSSFHQSQIPHALPPGETHVATGPVKGEGVWERLGHPLPRASWAPQAWLCLGRPQLAPRSFSQVRPPNALAAMSPPVRLGGCQGSPALPYPAHSRDDVLHQSGGRGLTEAGSPSQPPSPVLRLLSMTPTGEAGSRPRAWQGAGCSTA